MGGEQRRGTEKNASTLKRFHSTAEAESVDNELPNVSRRSRYVVAADKRDNREREVNGLRWITMSDSDSKPILNEVPDQLQMVAIGGGSNTTSEFPSVDTTPKLSKRNSSERSLPLRSYSKWSPSEQGATLVWRDLCVYTNVGSGQKMKRIINNSTGAVQPGSLMALMGAR